MKVATLKHLRDRDDVATITDTNNGTFVVNYRSPEHHIVLTYRYESQHDFFGDCMVALIKDLEKRLKVVVLSP